MNSVISTLVDCATTTATNYLYSWTSTPVANDAPNANSSIDELSLIVSLALAALYDLSSDPKPRCTKYSFIKWDANRIERNMKNKAASSTTASRDTIDDWPKIISRALQMYKPGCMNEMAMPSPYKSTASRSFEGKRPSTTSPLNSPPKQPMVPSNENAQNLNAKVKEPVIVPIIVNVGIDDKKPAESPPNNLAPNEQPNNSVPSEPIPSEQPPIEKTDNNEIHIPLEEKVLEKSSSVHEFDEIAWQTQTHDAITIIFQLAIIGLLKVQTTYLKEGARSIGVVNKLQECIDLIRSGLNGEIALNLIDKKTEKRNKKIKMIWQPILIESIAQQLENGKRLQDQEKNRSNPDCCKDHRKAILNNVRIASKETLTAFLRF